MKDSSIHQELETVVLQAVEKFKVPKHIVLDLTIDGKPGSVTIVGTSLFNKESWLHQVVREFPEFYMGVDFASGLDYSGSIEVARTVFLEGCLER